MIGRTLRGNLLVTELIGSGAMGTVYKAENVNLRDRKYAIKILKNELTDNPSFRARFHQEAENQSRLNHPNIVSVDDYFEEGGCYFLVLAFIDGRPLDNVIREGGALAEERALDIFGGILEGLDCAHKRGIIHRDIKPSNVLIDQDTGRALITDFGIAIQAGAARMTTTGAAVGTAAYMSPEQITRPQQVDHRSDLYSAGVVLYEMLTGKVPFDAETDFAIQEQQVNRAPPDPRANGRSIPPELVRMLFKALEKDPAKRYAGCREWLNDILAYRRVHTGGTVAGPWKWGIAAAVVVAVAVGAVVAMKRPAPLPPEPERPISVPDNGQNAAAASALVGAARQALAYFCNNLATIPLKETARQHAAERGNSAAVDRFAKQIEDLEANAKDHATQYVEDVRQLSKIDTASADAAFAIVAAEDMQLWQNEVEKDYRGLKDGRKVDRDAMQDHCAQAPRSPQS